MKYISSKLKMHIENISLTNNDARRLVLNIILGSFGALALSYVFFLGNMVSDILERRSFEINMRALGNEVQNLEAAYLSLSSDIDLNFSYSLGFRETKATFAIRKSLGLGPSGRSLDSLKAFQNDL